MPLYAYRCSVCGMVCEKLSPKAITPPPKVSEWCLGCQSARPHTYVISAPAVVRGPSQKTRHTRMAAAMPARDKGWKQRVAEGVNPDGRQLTNRLEESAKFWGVPDSSMSRVKTPQ